MTASASGQAGRPALSPDPDDHNEQDSIRIHTRDTAPLPDLPAGATKSSATGAASGYGPPSRPQPSSSRSPAIRAPLERKTSQSYGHARQASKSASQHRNGYLASTPSATPLSPEPSLGFVEGSVSGRMDAGHFIPRQPSRSPSQRLNGSNRPPKPTTKKINEMPEDAGDMNVTHKIIHSPSTANRQEVSHHASGSRGQAEKKTVGEYSLHHLFTRYLPLADYKIKQCLSDQSPRHDLSIKVNCGPGADESFDNLILAMAYITRRNPKPLVDTIMFWRQQRARGAKEVNGDSMSPQELLKSSRRQDSDDFRIHNSERSMHDPSSDEGPYLSEYRQSIAIYLTCRVLIEVFTHAEKSALSSKMYQKLESIIFDRLQIMDPNFFVEQPFKRATWEIYGQLLGIMSRWNLASVASLFINDLSASQKDLFGSGKAIPSKELEYRIEMTIHSMRHLCIRTHPESSWSDACNFLYSLTELIVNSHGAPIKYAYCHLIVNLFIPVASHWSPSLNTPKYRELLQALLSRVAGIASKPRHWQEAIGCQTVLLCATSDDAFSASWIPLFTSLQTRLKDRSCRATALQAIARLVWTYLNRLKEGGSAVRRLEDIVKIVFPANKKNPNPLDMAACEPLIELIRIIGFHHQEYCFNKVIFPLLSSDMFFSGKDIKVEHLDPEKMVVGIRSFLLILQDLEKAEAGKPQFPRFRAGGLVEENAGKSSDIFSALMQRDARALNQARPIVVSHLSSSTREYYARFCDILGRMTIICDQAFGGQAVLDEKFLPSHTPKTPMADNFPFGRRVDDQQAQLDHRLGIYELLHVAVQAIPQSLSTKGGQLKPLINLLCTCTAHVQSNIAASSIQSLKSIARQSHAQAVTIGFSRFIFNFDSRYSTMSEEGLLGPEHIEGTLMLYSELLQIWIEEIRQKSREAMVGASQDDQSGLRGRHLDLTSVTNHVDEIESHGLFFLCSQSRRVRGFAIKVLEIVTQFDTALGRETHRIIHILEGEPQNVVDVDDDTLTVAERSRLQKAKARGSTQTTLIEICSSDDSYDSTLWLRVFPNVVRLSFEQCPSAVMLGREIVCDRLLHMQPYIDGLENGTPPALTDPATVKTPNRLQSTSAHIIIAQWKLYLIVACTTVTSSGAQTQSQLDLSQHSRKSSKTSASSHNKLSSARELFSHFIPLLAYKSAAIRDAVVLALSSTNTRMYRILLESLGYAVTLFKGDALVRAGTHQRANSNPRKGSSDHMRTEVTQIYRLTARFLQDRTILQDDWIVTNLATYSRELMIFLSASDIQNDWDSQKLRRQFCGLVEEVCNGVNTVPEPSRYITFEFRKSAFSLMEDWCGFSTHHARTHQRDLSMRQMLTEHPNDLRDRSHLAASMETEKRYLSIAALNAMAALCVGPIKITSERGETLSFDSRRMLVWIDHIFQSKQEKMLMIGQKALYNLTMSNKHLPHLLEWSLDQCFGPERPQSLKSYFAVIIKVLNEDEDYQIPFWRLLATLVFLLGNEESDIRIQSVKMLQRLGLRRQQTSGIEEFDINISDRTAAVYKLASYEISSRLSKTHAALAFHVFSVFSQHFRNMHPDIQRQMVSSILSWIQMIELQVETSGQPTPHSYMVLANLFEITCKTSSLLHNEIQALWQALATGHPGNVQLVLDFVIDLCSERKDQIIVSYAKQIIVYMAHGAAGPKVIEFLLLKITPKNMVHIQREPTPRGNDGHGLPYIADLREVLPNVNKTESFALAHLAVVFLVDLIVKPMTVKSDQVPLLLHVIFVLWDHQISLIQEQARELLVHLIHEMVVTKVPMEMQDVWLNKRTGIEAFVDAVRHHQPSVIWQYREKVAKNEDWSTDDEVMDTDHVPSSMPGVTSQVTDIFAILYPNIQNDLARISLGWGTSCPVRHAACRSLQIFRCVLVPIDQMMLSDILARISNTIVHENADVQAFSMEMLTTVKSIITSLGPEELLKFPHLFWTICACLDTVIENEFVAALGMLARLLPKLNLQDPAVLKILLAAKPARWQDVFEGLIPLIYRGLKSESSLRFSLAMLDNLMALPSSEMVGRHPRLLFVTLANIPRFMHCIDNDVSFKECSSTATILAEDADADEANEHIAVANLAAVLRKFCFRQFKSSRDFMYEILAALRQGYFPSWELRALIFIIGLISNRSSWYRINVLEIVKTLLSDVEMHSTEVAGYGPDLISPLLRLLQTDFCPQAIEVLDHINYMAETPLSKQHMRMSFAGLGARSLPVRKEYDRTQSLYGIPEESGWSVPMPALHTTSTRNNMQLIYQECANSSAPAAEAIPTPEIEFHLEEEIDPSYFPLERVDRFEIQENAAEGGMGDLLTKLNSLDDFFDESHDDNTPVASYYSGLTGSTLRPDLDGGADVYDLETTPILQRTLGRTASVSSMHSTAPEISQRHIMNPAAFLAAEESRSGVKDRPALHTRSVTSPANNIGRLPESQATFPVGDEQSDAIFSEDERSTGRAVVNESRLLGNFSLRRANSAFRRAPSVSDSRESRARGLLRSHSRSHAPIPRSPSVPKLPDAYKR